MRKNYQKNMEFEAIFYDNHQLKKNDKRQLFHNN